MCAMPHSSLAGMTSDPRTGVVAHHSSVYIVMEKEDFGDKKEALIRKLNRNVNKFYPDAGGILMGYQGIKMKRSTSEVTPTTLAHPVHIRARFYLFQPQVGSDLLCVVTKKEEGRVTCLAQGVFHVEVYSPPQSLEAVYVGQVVVVKVEAVEQMAWQEPRIVATLLEVTGDNVTPFIDIVDNFDADEFESMTDSGMFGYEQNNVSNAGMSRGDGSRQILQKEETSKAEVNTSDSQSPQANVETLKGDGGSKPASKKRKVEEVSSAPAAVASPKKKRTRRESKSSPAATETASNAKRRTRQVSKSSVDSETIPTSHSSNSDNTDQFPVMSHNHPSVIPPPSPVKSMPPPAASSSSKSKPSPKKTPSKILSRILPKPPAAQSKSADSDHDNSSDDEVANVEKNSKPSEPTVAGISKTIQDPVNDTVVPNLLTFDALAAPVTPGKPPKLIVPPKTPKPKGRVECPPGFKDESEIPGGNDEKKRKKRVRLTAPDGGVYFSYKSAWEWVDKNPGYLVKSEPESSSASLASPIRSGRSSPDMFNSQPESVEITPVVDGGEAADKVPEVPQVNSKQPKIPKKFVPTQQKLLIDPPSFSESEAELPQSLNLLVPESDTEYQSQSLLAPPSKDAKKADKAVKNATVGFTKSPKKVKAASSLAKSVTKSPGKPIFDSDADSGADSGAESSFESTKQIKAVPPSTIVPKQSPSTNVDGSRTSSNSSSEDSSSDEEPPTQNRSVVENVPVKQPTVPTSDDDSSSYESDSSDDDTVTDPKVATRPSETVVKKAVSSSSDSDSDSSEESEMEVNKFDHPVTVIVTDPVVTATAAKESSDLEKKVQETTKQVSKPVKIQDKKPSSSSSDTDSKDALSQPPAKQKKKLTKKKNSPKPNVPTAAMNTSEESSKVNTSATAEKSPHLSSTVMSGTDRLKDKMMVPDGISPILKNRHKTKTPAKPNGMAYFDQVMATSKMGSQKSEGKPAELDSSASDKNANKKKKKKVAGFL